MIRSEARVMVLECSNYFLQSDLWINEVQRIAVKEHVIGSAELSASQVNIPSGRKRTYVVMVKKEGLPRARQRLSAWKRAVERPVKSVPSLGAFLGRTGTYFLARKQGERRIFSFDEPALSISRAHIMGTKPRLQDYHAHRTDHGPFSQATELSFEDFKKLLTTNRDYGIPLTVSRGVAADVLANYSPPSMMREGLMGLKLQGFFEERVHPKDQVFVGLAALEVTPAVTRSSAKKPTTMTGPADSDPPVQGKSGSAVPGIQAVPTAKTPTMVPTPSRQEEPDPVVQPPLPSEVGMTVRKSLVKETIRLLQDTEFWLRSKNQIPCYGLSFLPRGP